MLSITKINSSSNQAKRGDAGGYLHYLGGPSTTTKQRGDFDDYARGDAKQAGLQPTWACSGASLLGLSGVAQPEQVERLAKGFHPLTGEELVRGAGEEHVMGLDMTFSAPKDVSAVFAGGDGATREAVANAVMQAAKAALAHVESQCVTRHGSAGHEKRFAQAALAACYPHFSSRAGEPQLHVHGFLFNLGKREGDEEWSALEQRAQFERKMATGILFRAELASRMKALGFEVEADGKYFTLRGINQAQRDALSSRSKQIAEYVRECGMLDGAAAREVAALNTRQAKAEPPLPELLASFSEQAAAIGLTPQSVAAMRTLAPSPASNSAQNQASNPAPTPACDPAGPLPNADQRDQGAAPCDAPIPFELDHDEVMERLMESQSCATSSDALALICEMAMGHWDAARCVAELGRFMASPLAVRLGRTEQLEDVFTSTSTLAMETECSQAVGRGAEGKAHRLNRRAIDREFDRLEAEISAKIGAPASLAQQRAAALHVACQTGDHAFVEGWAGTGKTTMLKALGDAYEASGFEVLGCCQSAAASQNLARETGIPSRTIASLLHALGKGKAKLGAQTILVLDEAGMVGSKEFSLLQRAVLDAGGKLVAVGDAKQLQPIAAGGIFRALCERHGKVEISNIQRQRTDFGPLLDWLRSRGELSKRAAAALRQLPEDARLGALESLCAALPKLARAFARWRERYDHRWLRAAVRKFALGDAKQALSMLDEKGRLKLISGHTAALDALISDWAADKAPLRDKTMIAGSRAEVRELNEKARALLISAGQVRDGQALDIEIIHRDDAREIKRFAPGDRVVFTKNDKTLGVANGVAGTIVAIDQAAFTPLLRVELDDANELGETVVMVPPAFGRFDHGYCLTNHKSQGRTFDSAYCLVNPAMADREWTYVAASRSRFSTTLYVNRGALAKVYLDSHQPADKDPELEERADQVEKLAFSMSKSRPKGTALDWTFPVKKAWVSGRGEKPARSRGDDRAPGRPEGARSKPRAARPRPDPSGSEATRRAKPKRDPAPSDMGRPR
ncbi:relaxase domain-containing protein [Massilia forsythiae]|uniref:Relaxase domain-containing protein n=1 Tax=Massilia forsythiae TaxID=2728020 RepID=A0A7Z2W077_9BURK|nr:MobF family relaxase [Massilia forsythiae]QJE02526.1 relaxase domain-containing protein [Massilia forsythiae]